MTGVLNDKIAVVTGAGHGIGSAIAQRFATAGARVVVNDIDSAVADATVAAIVDAGGTATAVAADVADADAVATLFAEVHDTYDGLDVLVNNAGLVGPMQHFLDGDAAWFRRIVDVNLMGTIWCSRQAANAMARQGSGVIINLSSGGASRAHRQFTAYDATKGGIEALTRAMALDLGPYGVRVNALMPGSIDTSGASLDDRQARGADLPLERVGEPHDLAGPAVFLASDDAAYITGEVLRVDGGMLAQQRSATVDLCPPSAFPAVGDVRSVADLDGVGP